VFRVAVCPSSIKDARFLKVKMLNPLSNTTSTHVHIPIHTLKYVVNISSRNLILNMKFNDGMLKKRNIVVGYFVSRVASY
jgi:hypothetical protein